MRRLRVPAQSTVRLRLPKNLVLTATRRQAAVYGAVVGGATAVSVDVAEAGSTYTVEAQIVDRRATNLTWKARQCPL